jgi:hypothetical protein
VLTEESKAPIAQDPAMHSREEETKSEHDRKIEENEFKIKLSSL